MARARRTSSILETAQQRLNGLNSITPAPNLGANLTPASFATAVTAFSTRLNSYNEHVAALDDEQNQLQVAEKELRDLNRRILSAVEAQFGPDSSEYEQVGGTRTSERRRTVRRPTAGGGPTPAPHS
jgi:hypothetical protein